MSISEIEGKTIAMDSLWSLIEVEKTFGKKASFSDGGIEILADRVLMIAKEDVVFNGMMDNQYGQIENGEIYQFNISGISEIEFGVYVFNNCNTQVMLSIK